MQRGYNPYGNRGIQIGQAITPGVKYLIIANFAVFLLELLAPRFSMQHFGLIPYAFIYEYHIWTPLTYMFLHAPNDPWHILLNMLGLWMFGVVLERRWGTRSFVQFYLFSGLIAAAFVLVGGFLFGTAAVTTIGASGAILATIMAFGLIFPDEYLYIYFLFPVKAKYFLMFIVGITLLYGITGSSGGTSIPAHAGGLFAGWILIRGYYNPRIIVMNMRKHGLSFKLWNAQRKRKKHNLRVIKDKDDDKNRRDPPGGYYH